MKFCWVKFFIFLFLILAVSIVYADKSDKEDLYRIENRINESVNTKIQRLDTRIDAGEKAIALYENELSRRLEELNRLRGEVTKDREQFVRKEYHDILEKQIAINTNRLTAIESSLSAGKAADIAWIAGLGIFFTIMQIIIGVLIYSKARGKN